MASVDEQATEYMKSMENREYLTTLKDYQLSHVEFILKLWLIRNK